MALRQPLNDKPSNVSMDQLNNTWSRLEITDHPQVNHCFDRGNSFFDEDVPMLSRQQSNRTSSTNHNWRDITQQLSDELWDAIENPPEWGGAVTIYLPRRKLRSIVTPERVGCIISGLESFNDHEVETLVHAAFHGGLVDGTHRNPSVKLLAALACCGAVDNYLDLVNQMSIEMPKSRMPPDWPHVPRRCWHQCPKHILPMGVPS
ncbi:hypothetical protein PG991_002909 [Apiospora marii]|uniref:Uncharacterized protein n=1 Tax=Apiospora marii TaxID=335849 RepID=A0ABR1SGT0_9PEZI